VPRYFFHTIHSDQPRSTEEEELEDDDAARLYGREAINELLCAAMNGPDASFEITMEIEREGGHAIGRLNGAVTLSSGVQP
jgi:hypothetical protein